MQCLCRGDYREFGLSPKGEAEKSSHMRQSTLIKEKEKKERLHSTEAKFIMQEVERRFLMLEESLDGFKKEIRDTFLAMEHTLETLSLKMVELQSELFDWEDLPPGSVSKH